MQRAAQAYFQTQVTTTSQGDLVIMLYDGAVKFLTQAKEHLAANDMARKGLAISKALDVINELDSALNMEKGGSLSTNLHSLYLFCSNHLVMANLKKDADMIDHVLKILLGLRSAYSQIVALPEAQTAAEEAASNLHADAILPPRAQAGFSPSGGATPVPGANARIRSLYAKNAAAEASAEEAAPTSLPDRSAEATAPAQDPAPHEPPPANGFMPAAGFAGKAGMNMYRKFSGQ